MAPFALGFDLATAWLLHALSRHLEVAPAQVLTLALEELARSRDLAIDAHAGARPARHG